MPLLIVTAVEGETKAVGRPADVTIVTGGIGRTNAAAATTAALLEQGPFDAVISAGVAGALPDGDAAIGDTIVASACAYAEEGIVTPEGFSDIGALGFSLGDFAGNRVPVDERLLEALAGTFRTGVIATVATCSGTDEQARRVVARTGAIAEAMEGAAVVHAARRLGVPAIELRTISNTTGDRAGQSWDLARGLDALASASGRLVEMIRSCDLRG
jgi:futalosine hydrolase